MASQVVNLKASGLQTYYQSLMELSPGALLKANNTVINRSGVIEPRRGFKAYGPAMPNLTDRAKQLFQYRNVLIRHIGTTLAYDDGSGNFTNFIGSYSEPISGYRIKSVEAKSNIYFTTNESVKKISTKSGSEISSSSIENVGVPKAYGGKGVCIFYGNGFFPAKGTEVNTTGYLTKDYFVAYRIVWAITDANDNLLLGSPSERILVSNIARVSQASVALDFPIPNTITTKYKYRIYRSEVSSSTPSDEMNLIYEDSPTQSQISSATISFTDRISEESRLGGVPLYTNQYSGEGILKSNDTPPSALDLALFNGHMFYANTKLKEFVEIELKKMKDVSSTNVETSFTSGVSDLVFSDGTNTERYFFEGTKEEYTLTFVGAGTLTTSAKYTYIDFFSANDERRYRLRIENTSSTQVFVESPPPKYSNLLELGSISVNSTFNANQIANLVLAKLYSSYGSAVFDFDIYVEASTGVLRVTNNSNGITTNAQILSSADITYTSLVTYANVTQGKGEDVVNKKVLLSNGFSPTASTSGVSWSANGTVISCPSGTTGFVVGKAVQSGNTIPQNVLITQVAANQITVNTPIPTAGTSRMLVQLADTDLSIEQTCQSLVRVINSTPSSKFNAIYLASSTLSPGKMLFERKTFTEGTFYIGTFDFNICKFFTPEIGKAFSNSAVSLTNPTKITNTLPMGVTSNELSTGDIVVIYGATSSQSINGVHSVTVVNSSEFTIQKNVTSVSITGVTLTSKLKSSNEAVKNRIYYSKLQQPEAVPILNYIDVGSKDYEISRILSSKESLFILKRDGIFRLVGEGGNNPIWNVSSFDNTLKIIAPDSATILANDCYFLGNQGYIKLSESGTSYISTGIEDKLLPFVNTSANNISTASFSIPYESDRCLLAWTILSKNDQYARVCYRFNVLTQTWTEWRIEKTCGILNPFQDKLYLGSAIDNYLEVERKDFSRYDYADRELDLVLSSLSLNENKLKIGSFELASSGDVLTQTQYVTIFQFNTFLKKLDLDASLDVHEFYNDYKLSAGESLTAKMNSVVARLDIADPSVNYSALWTSPTDFPTIQTQYNAIVAALNASSGASFINYKQSIGTTVHEAIVDSVDYLQKELTLSSVPSFMVGQIKLYKAISSEIEYAPQHAGDVSGLKQFSSGTFLFERRSFHDVKISFNSDVSDSFEDIDFYLNFSGSYGTFAWGEGSIWGGQGDQAQIRTYIPLRKQKCRFLGCKLTHNTAFESFELYGVSLSVRLFSTPERGYK